jgi:diguanylate cyclase (GGDEF)-like protein
MVVGEGMLASPDQFIKAMTASPDGFSIWNALRGEDGAIRDFEFRFMNAAAAEMLRRSPEDLIGRLCSDVFYESARHLISRWGDSIERAGQFHEEIAISLRGEKRWIHQQVLSIGEAVVVVSQDVTERRSAQIALERMALHDPLTGLPNRALAADRIKWSLAQQRRLGGVTAVMFIDLDHFKKVNDSLGHAIGDHVLVEVASRMRAAVPSDAILARLGGDEFLICAHLPSEDAAMIVAERTRLSLNEPIRRAGRNISISCSIGVVCATNTREPDDLIRNADRAGYEAKRLGRSRVSLFDEAMRERISDELTIEAEFRDAINNNDLQLYYQPIVDTRTGKSSEFEALVRWQHPERGLLLPSSFIDIAEETGLVVALGRWVVQEVARQISEWEGSGLYAERVWINMSAVELSHQGYGERISSVAAEHGLDPSRIGVELTERVLLDEALEAGGEFADLAKRGFPIAIDDFGVGFSSLRYLHVHPVHTLKIDKAFVSTVDMGPRETAIPNAVVRLGHGLGFRVTAECVETTSQAVRLVELGCDHLSGFLFAPPTHPDHIAEAVSSAEAVFARL